MSPTLSEYPGPALPIADLRDAWLVLSKADRADGFRILKRSDAEDFFLGLSAGDMSELLHALPEKERRVWVRLLAPDDAADLLQTAPAEDRDKLFIAKSDKKVRDVMASELVTVGEEVHQEEVSRLFADAGLMAIPVVDAEGRIKGIVTVDDIVDVVQEEATEDAQKFGGMEALEE